MQHAFILWCRERKRLTPVQLGAEGNAPQYGSVALVVIFYATDFQLVQYIPKAAFSCLLVLAFLDMTSTWIFKSYAKTRNKWEWSIAPIIVVLSFCIGMLNAIFVGIAFSTFIFVGSFYRSGVVKFLGTGLILRSTTERSYRETSWLDQNGDLLQIVVLQNYLFFGNSQSLYYYIQTMFEDVDDQIKFDSPLPPKPKYLIVDFTIVTGIDTSAVDLIRETIDLCRINQCRLFITGLSKDLRLTLIYSGVKADRTISFVSDLERALSKAEDGLLNNVLHIKEQDVQIAGSRQRSRSVSNSDDGFRYALKKIDEQVRWKSTVNIFSCIAPALSIAEQHHLNYADKLSDLEKSTTVIELKNGEALFRDEGGRIDDSERGFFFIEFGRMRIEQDAHSTLARQTGKGTQSSIGRLNARAPVFGHQASRLKEQSRRAAEADSGAQFFRLARIGQGHVVGSIEACSGLRSQGQHIAETACRLHHLPYHKVSLH